MSLFLPGGTPSARCSDKQSELYWMENIPWRRWRTHRYVLNHECSVTVIILSYSYANPYRTLTPTHTLIISIGNWLHIVTAPLTVSCLALILLIFPTPSPFSSLHFLLLFWGGFHVFGWRDLFDTVVRWRQLSEPMDVVYWLDRWGCRMRDWVGEDEGLSRRGWGIE